MLRKCLNGALTIGSISVILLILLGTALGQPVLFSFVVSDSMSPTIEKGDGFVAIPSQVSGEVQRGDVVVYEAQELSGGGLTTHRVVGKTDAGYITKGDANPFTDQDGPEPPVTRDDIVATAWQPGGYLIRVPALGTVILETRATVSEGQRAIANTIGVQAVDDSQQTGMVLLLAGAVVSLFAVVNAIRRQSGRTRTRRQNRDTTTKGSLLFVILLLVAAVVVPANAAMILPGTTHVIPVGEIASENNIEPGEQVEVSMSASNSGLVTVFILLEASPNAELAHRTMAVPRGKEATTIVSAPAPPATDAQQVSVSERRYVLLLPPAAIVYLYNIHPLAPLVAINVLLILGISTLAVGIAGVDQRRKRTVSRNISLQHRIKRFFRQI